MLGAAGVTAMLDSVFTGVVTVRTAVPFTLLSEAVMLLDPAATPVARPAALMVAVAVLELVQVADDVMFAVEPSLYVPVAVNCCVALAVMLAVAGVTAMVTSVFGTTTALTVSEAVPLTPLNEAVMVDDPAATAVANPAVPIVAAAVLELVHVALEVTLPVEPSL
jgi:hypothetical protein